MTVQRLYPPPWTPELPLAGLYLEQPLPPEPAQGAWLYTNFVTSLDGRISLDHGGGCRIPGSIANDRDWRLFQELAARADCLITTGRYLRELAAGCAQDILPLGAEFDDLRRWREAAGMPAQPDVAIVSASLDFAIPPLLSEQGRRLWLLAPREAAAERLAAHRRAGAEVLPYPGGEQAEGAGIRHALERLGYRRIYSVAGPQLARTLIAGGALDTLFLTVRHRVIGGAAGSFETLIEGAPLTGSQAFELRWLYLDPAPEGAGQHFARLDATPAARRG